MKRKKLTQLILTLLIALMLPLSSSAKEINEEEIQKSLPKMLGSGNAGMEFYFSFIPAWGGSGMIKIYVTSNVRTKVKLEITGKGFEKIKYTEPNDIIQFEISPSLGEPYRKSGRDKPLQDQIWPNAGVCVKSDAPVICYGVTNYNYTSEGFLALPTAALGTEYIVASNAEPTDNTSQILPGYTSVTAPYDDIKVEFTMGGSDYSKTAGGQMPGETTTWRLNQGDVLLIASSGSHADLTGSKIKATKPVAVVSGNFCAYVPTNCGCCDLLEEMELPMKTWGTEYHVTKIIKRQKASIIRLFAKEPSTKIYRDYKQIGFLNNSGGVRDVGWLELRANEGEPRPIVISSDKPISVTQYNTGQSDDGVPSDPFQMVLTPVEQYQREITFITPEYTENYINICYITSGYGVIPDNLEIARAEKGEFEWEKIKNISPKPGVPFEKKQGNNKLYYQKTLLLQGNQAYIIKADEPFGVYAHGFKNHSAYGFPAAANPIDLTKNDSLPPKPTWVSDSAGAFGIGKGEVEDMPNNPDSRSNLSSIYMHSDKSYNYEFDYGDFMPCEDSRTGWSLDRIDWEEDSYAVITFSDCAGNDTTIFIIYRQVKLDIVPKTYDFGLIPLGELSEKKFYIVNKSETAQTPAMLIDARLKLSDELGKDQHFNIYDETGSQPLSLPQFIEPLDSLPFIVKFDAAEQGIFWDSIGVGDTNFFWYKAYLDAEVGAPVISVENVKFDTIVKGSAVIKQFDVKNIGVVNLEVYDYEGPFLKGDLGEGEYNIFKSEDLIELNIGYDYPLVLKPQETQTFEIQFQPDDDKFYQDSILFISNTAKKDIDDKKADSVCVVKGTGKITSIEDNPTNAAKKIEIYPNPAENNLKVEAKKPCLIEIYDLLGNKLFSKEYKKPEISVDLTPFRSGAYFIKVASGDNIYTRKFTINK